MYKEMPDVKAQQKLEEFARELELTEAERKVRAKAKHPMEAPRMHVLAASVALPRIIAQENRMRANQRRTLEGFLLSNMANSV